MNKLIFWDWTGTLADEAELDKAVCRRMEQDIAREAGISIEQAASRYQDYLKKREKTWRWHDYVVHCHDFGINWKSSQESHIDKLRLVPGAGDMLAYARSRGYKNILATNAVRRVIELRAAYAGIDHLLDMIIASDDVQALKSEGRHFQRGLREWLSRPEVSFSVGDNPIQDIRPALELGLTTVFCAYGRHLTHYHSTHISDDHVELVCPSFSITELSDIRYII